MPKRPIEILLIEPDEDLAELIDGYLSQAMSARITCVKHYQEGLAEELTARHDLVIATMPADSSETLDFVRQLRVTNHGPVVLLAESCTAGQAIDALRLRVDDILPKPFDLLQLYETLVQSLTEHQLRRRLRRRNRRLRLLTGRILRERRDLRERIDLICQDLVRAYHRLASKVAEQHTGT